jgi:hypothetical protein
MLNLFRLAYPLALAGIVILGLGLAALAKRQDGVRLQMPSDLGTRFFIASWATAFLALTGFMIATQLAPSLYNPGDDLHHYFPHAVRMVETGTLFGSPLNGLGGITLGGQAFLHGFIVGFFPLRFINSVDAVYCFFLCLTLPGAIALNRPPIALAALAGTLVVFIIDPQHVNVSSLFSTVAVVAALTILRVDPREGGESDSPSWRRTAAPALFYAGAIALKPTSVIFLGLQFVIASTLSCWERQDWRSGLANAGRIAVWSAIFIGPWLLLYAPYYLIALTNPIGRPLTAIPQVRVSTSIASLFSPAETFYGPTTLAYTCVAAGLFLCALNAVADLGMSKNRKSSLELGSATTAAGASYLFWTLIAPHIGVSTDVFRYSIPVLIGVASAAMPLCVMVSVRRGTTVLVIAALIVMIVLFGSSTMERMARLLHQGTDLAFLHRWSPAGISHARRSMKPELEREMMTEVQGIQAIVPPGDPLLAWTAAPFLLDYRRNKIIDVNEEGLSKPWGRVFSFRYVLRQYIGYGVDTEQTLERDLSFGLHPGRISARALDFMHWMDLIQRESKTLNDQNGLVLFETNDQTPLPPN